MSPIIQEIGLPGGEVHTFWGGNAEDSLFFEPAEARGGPGRWPIHCLRPVELSVSFARGGAD